LIRFILSKDFPGGHFKKFEFFLISARIWREDAPAPWILGPLGLALTDAVCLWLFLNLVNDHAARLVVRERLRVITVARMHPHA